MIWPAINRLVRWALGLPEPPSRITYCIESEDWDWDEYFEEREYGNPVG